MDMDSTLPSCMCCGRMSANQELGDMYANVRRGIG